MITKKPYTVPEVDEVKEKHGLKSSFTILPNIIEDIRNASNDFYIRTGVYANAVWLGKNQYAELKHAIEKAKQFLSFDLAENVKDTPDEILGMRIIRCLRVDELFTAYDPIGKEGNNA